MDTNLDIERAISFAFKDPKWIGKIGIAALLTLSILGIPAVYGWVMETQRRVIAGTETDTLPEWDDLGSYLIEGLKLLGVYLLWGLPFWLVSFALWIVGFSLMFIIIFAWPEIPEFLFAFTTILPMYGLQILGQGIQVLLVVIRPITTGLYLEENHFPDAFQLKHGAKLFAANFWINIAVVFLGYIAGQLLHMVGIVFFIVALAITTPLSMLITHHLYGQAYRIAKIKLAAKELAAS